MPENDNVNRDSQEPSTPTVRRRFFTRRNTMFVAGLGAILLILVALLTVVSYRYGVLDNYVKTQFVKKMTDIGMDFKADVFRLTISPLELELKNATFNDHVSGEKLFFIRD